MKLTDTPAVAARLARDQLLNRCIAIGNLMRGDGRHLGARETARQIERAVGPVPRETMNAALYELGFTEEIE